MGAIGIMVISGYGRLWPHTRTTKKNRSIDGREKEFCFAFAGATADE